MRPADWTRRVRGLIVATLVAAGTGALFDHHHADHDGTLLHLEEDHGTHGETVAPTAEQVPAAVHAAVPAAPARAVALPDVAGPPIRAAAGLNPGVRAVGHDPPNAHGPRAPPA